MAEVEAILDRCRAADGDFSAEQRTILTREPFEVDADSEIVGVVRDVVADASRVGEHHGRPVLGRRGVHRGGRDPDGDVRAEHGAHAVEEWVSISDAEVVTKVFVDVASRFCA